MRPCRDDVQEAVRQVFLSVRRGKELVQVLDRGKAEEHMQGWPAAVPVTSEPK